MGSVLLLRLLLQSFRMYHVPGKPKIRQFYYALAVDEDVTAFDITVDNPPLVHVLQSFKHLLKNVLELHFSEHHGLLFNQLLQVVLHVLEHQVNGFPSAPHDFL